MVAAKSGILTDVDTFEASRHSKTLHFERLKDIMVKGKAHPIAIFVPSKGRVWLLHVNVLVKSKVEEFLEIGNPIVGRQFEIRAISKRVRVLKRIEQLSRFESVTYVTFVSSTITDSPPPKRNETQVLVIDGPEGVGKSRLVLQMQLMIRSTRCKILIGYAEQLRANTAYYVWQDMFSNNCIDGKGTFVGCA